MKWAALNSLTFAHESELRMKQLHIIISIFTLFFMYMSVVFAGQKGPVRQELHHQGKVTVLTHKGIENPIPLFLILKYHKLLLCSSFLRHARLWLYSWLMWSQKVGPSDRKSAVLIVKGENFKFLLFHMQIK